MSTGTTSEDCLTINIFAPSSATPTSNLPVLMWTYGGAFVSGSANSYNGTTIVASTQNVVYVSFNYRVGIMGSFQTSRCWRKDMVRILGCLIRGRLMSGLKSILRRLEETLGELRAFGQSAGSQSIALQLISFNGTSVPFQAAIMESGTYTSFHDTLSAQDQSDYTATVANSVGCASASDLMACLRAVNGTTINGVSAGTGNPRSMACFCWTRLIKE
ncbi:Alpha/Beta hydrolase protein [Chytridium lagenaria]|nr:Alpha/Beta hydrolase protein [Chytridium lagenaria]